MKTAIELCKDLRDQDSILQRDELVNRLAQAGVPISASGHISTINTETVELSPWRGRWSLEIHYASGALRTQLLQYSEGDEVEVVLRPTSGSVFWKGEDGPCGKLQTELVSINRLRTKQQVIEAVRATTSAGTEPAKKAGDCFIATAAFGQEDSALLVLRKYRDDVLNHSTVGRYLVLLYNVVSPSIARFVIRSERRRRMTRHLLSPIVRLLRSRLRRTLEKNNTQ